jgi:hypothetical protein
MKTRIYANNEKLEVLRGSFVSRMDIHQVRTEDTQEETIAKMDPPQERMKACTNS